MADEWKSWINIRRFSFIRLVKETEAEEYDNKQKWNGNNVVAGDEQTIRRRRHRHRTINKKAQQTYTLYIVINNKRTANLYTVHSQQQKRNRDSDKGKRQTESGRGMRRKSAPSNNSTNLKKHSAGQGWSLTRGSARRWRAVWHPSHKNATAIWSHVRDALLRPAVRIHEQNIVYRWFII